MIEFDLVAAAACSAAAAARKQQLQSIIPAEVRAEFCLVPDNACLDRVRLAQTQRERGSSSGLSRAHNITNAKTQ